MSPAAGGRAVSVRPLQPGDLERVVEIDAHHTGVAKAEHWERLLGEFLRPREGPLRIALAAAASPHDEPAGYLLGEVRAFEFGSEACGWVLAVGVAPGWERTGVASRLLEEACRCFRAEGVARVRTMVRRDDVPVLAFFRWNGFHGGSFVQLERALQPAEEV